MSKRLRSDKGKARLRKLSGRVASVMYIENDSSFQGQCTPIAYAIATKKQDLFDRLLALKVDLNVKGVCLYLALIRNVSDESVFLGLVA